MIDGWGCRFQLLFFLWNNGETRQLQKLNSPQIHLYLQIVTMLVTHQVSAHSCIPNRSARLWHYRCGCVCAPSGWGEPAPWSPPEPLRQGGAITLGKLESFASGCSLSLKRCYSNFIKKAFSPLIRYSRCSLIRKSINGKCFALGKEAYFSRGNFSFTSL